MVAAVHPPNGGNAPGIAPTEVLIQDTFFKGVYNARYETTVQNAKMLVKVFTFSNNIAKPKTINDVPRKEAVKRDIFFVGNTLSFVLFIFASVSTSITLFNTDEPAEHNKVPRRVYSNSSGD